MATSDRLIAVVCDAGPLIHLDELSCIDLLRDFRDLLVPESVWQEVRRHRPTALPKLDWIDGPIAPLQSIDSEVDSLSRLFTLHRGERDALQLARAHRDAWLLSDDTAARLAANALKIETHGTIGILIRAIRRELRSRQQIVDLLESIPRQSTLFIKRSLLDDIVRQVRDLS